MTPIRFTEGAVEQLAQALNYIARDGPTRADLFRPRMQNDLERLAPFPEWDSPADEAGIGYVPVLRTGYLLFYDLDLTGVRIVRVRHASRRPMHT